MMTVNKNTWEVWLSLQGSHACETDITDVEGWVVRIQRAGAASKPAVHNTAAPCGITLPTSPLLNTNTADVLEYPVLDANGDRICIFFDSLLHQQPSGYYTAEVFNKENTRLATFMLHIPTEAYHVADSRTTPTVPCSERL